ncbi:unnamed protein product [Nesidiocoris tenuis]|uniref:Uncharacterized protein n=1 Tax=Nesidiocoris tenuis TaxID=355587 RepID=A0A6H5H7W8_9HEMI|nr:unnamed protein product [Nesidiocoris tenuis]
MWPTSVELSPCSNVRTVPTELNKKTHLKCHLGLRHGHLLSSTTGRICYTTGRRNALIASAQERPARKMELPINAKEMMNPKLVDLRKNNSFLVSPHQPVVPLLSRLWKRFQEEGSYGSPLEKKAARSADTSRFSLVRTASSVRVPKKMRKHSFWPYLRNLYFAQNYLAAVVDCSIWHILRRIFSMYCMWARFISFTLAFARVHAVDVFFTSKCQPFKCGYSGLVGVF